MKANTYQRVPMQFGPNVEFEVTPVPQAQARSALAARFGKLQDLLLQQLLQEAQDSPLRSHLTQAANEAAALAWTTPYPLLVLPGLLEEKAQEARFRAERQHRIQVTSQEILETVL